MYEKRRVERRGNLSSEGWKWTLHLTTRTVFDPSPESNFGEGRQGPSFILNGWGQKSTYKPSKLPGRFCRGRRCCEGPGIGEEQQPQQASTRGEQLASKWDASPVERFLSRNHPSFPDKKKYLRSSSPPPSPVPLLAGSISEDCSTHPGVFI